MIIFYCYSFPTYRGGSITQNLDENGGLYMNLLQEYKNQNIWREWERYINKLPLNPNQTVYDLGCSIGEVSKLFSAQVKKVIGFDNDKHLLEEANKKKQSNCEFILENIFTINPTSLKKCDGIWMSFTLAYMGDPSLFISNWTKCLNNGGWFGIVDIDGLFSSHLSDGEKYFNEIEAFEKKSAQDKIYDFRIGSKIKKIMQECGLEIVVSEENWYDRELNFNGKATEDIVENWRSRLERMVFLKSYFGTKYPEFCKYFLNIISEESHITNACVKFYVGVKR